MTDIQEIYSILLARNFQEELFSDLPGKRKREGKETRAVCPFCQSEDNFSYSRDKPLWRCWSCQEAGDWISYLEKVKGYTFQQAKLELADRAGVEVSPQEKASYYAYTRRADLLETAQAYFTDLLDKKEGEPVFNYLMERGYALEDIYGMELGAFTNRKALLDLLKEKGYSQQEITDSKLLTIGEDWPLVFLWRDQAGRATGIAGRAILSAQELKERGLQKYRYSVGLEKDKGLIGFSSARGAKSLIVVEAPLDALLLNHKGFKAVGVGGDRLSVDQLKAMEAVGTKELLLALDSDQAGQKATERILSDLRTSSLRVYVISLPAGFKDPDELIRAEGSDAFQKALDRAERGSAWTARRIMARHDTTTDRGTDQALEEALDYYSDITDTLEARGFMDSLREATGLSETDLAKRVQEASRTATARRSQALMESRLKDIQQKVSQGDLTGAESDLARSLREIRSSRGVRLPEPYLLEDLYEDARFTSPSLSTGYSLLDSMAKIPGGALTIIAGRPGHGKTTFLLNLLVNMLQIYPDNKFYYFSYEESRLKLATKLAMIMAGVEIQRETNYGAYVNYLQERRPVKKGVDYSKIDQALSQYKTFTDSGRLLLSDDMYPAEDLASVMELLARQGDTGAVFIDYIQKVSLLSPAQGGQRYLDIKRVSEILLRQAVSLDIPIILGAQLGRDKQGSNKVRLDNLRESGDIEQDANLVLGLYAEAMELEAQDIKVKRDPETSIKISILKNRNGEPGRSQDFSCNFAIYKIYNKER